MRILPLNSFSYYNSRISNNKKAPLSPVIKNTACDTVSFGAVKKSQFQPIELALVEKYKLPIEKYSSVEDLQMYAEKELEKLEKKPFDGKNSDTGMLRKQLLNEWFDYFKANSDKYPPSTRFLVCNEICNKLNSDTEKLPPTPNSVVIDETLEQIHDGFSKDKHFSFNFENLYRKNLSRYMSKNATDDNDTTGWVHISSQKHDEANFEHNVQRLKALSYPTWCTANKTGKLHLENCDFHVYVVDGITQAIMRIKNGKIVEIQGIDNNSLIPPKYLDEIVSHIKESGLMTSEIIKERIYDTCGARDKRYKEINDFKELLKTVDKTNPEEVFPLLGIEVKVLENKKFELSEYYQPDKDISFADIGIDEQKLFENVEKINGNATFSNSSLKRFTNLKYIDGDADFANSRVKNLGSLTEVSGSVNFKQSKVSDLGNLQFVGECNFSDCKFDTLKNLKSVAGYVNFENAQIKSLGKLKYTGTCNFKNAKIKTLENIEQINGDAIFTDSKIVDLGKLKYIQGNACFSYSNIRSLGNLEEIGGNADFSNSRVDDTGNLREIGGNADFAYCNINRLKNLQCIRGNANFRDSLVLDIGDLHYIGKLIFLEHSILPKDMIMKLVNSKRNNEFYASSR